MRLIDADVLLSELDIARREAITPMIKHGLTLAEAIVDSAPTARVKIEANGGHIDAEKVAEIVAQKLRGK